MIDFEAIGEVSDAIPTGVAVVLRGTVRVCDDDDSVASVDKFLSAGSAATRDSRLTDCEVGKSRLGDQK